MKNELRNIFSGKSKVSNGAIIQAISHYLRNCKETSEAIADEKHLKKQETTIIIILNLVLS